MKGKKNIVFYLIGFISALSLSVVAGLLYKAEEVEYTPKDESWDVNSVSDALNDLKDNYINKQKYVGRIWDFEYKGAYEAFISLFDATYKIETWGAQGGGAGGNYYGGYGGYSVGEYHLNYGDSIYIRVGGAGSYSAGSGGISAIGGGFNGGGNGTRAGDDSYVVCGGSGGGATTVTKTNVNGLNNYSSKQDDIIIVSGGGGGASVNNYSSYMFAFPGGSAGGYSGIGYSGEKTRCTPGTQVGGAAFGYGGSYASYVHGAAGGGGGYYGGTGGGVNAPGCGGSGFVKNLNDGIMYCYNCPESDDENYRTVSTTGSNELADKINCPSGYSGTPISRCAKAGHGYARITLVSID